MKKLNLGLTRKNAAQLIGLGTLVSGKLAPAAPTPPPIPNMEAKAAALLTATNEADAANSDYEDAKAALVNLKLVRDAKIDALRAAHSSMAKAVESECNGNPVLLSASGYDLAHDAVKSTTAPGQVRNVSVTAGDADGTLDVQHEAEDFASSYELQLTTGDPVTGPWVTKCSQTSSRCTLRDLTSGQRVWVRLRALGANGNGPWSDPATKIVP